ncbi:MAG: T9SS type B sorting domain-containing protein [Flavisolibacter sp.]
MPSSFRIRPQLTACLLFTCILFQVAVAQSPGMAVNRPANRFVDPMRVLSVDSMVRLQKFYVPPSQFFPGQPKLQSLRASAVPARFQHSHETTQPSSVHPNRTNEICYTISGRDFLYQDSVNIWTGDPTRTADGHVILSGEYADYSKTPLISGGLCMKTDDEGNVIWSKLYDSSGHKDFDFMNFFESLELHDGNILLAGRTENDISGNEDLALMKTDAQGNIIWLKTYASRYWQGYHGSGDYFDLAALKEDPTTGEIYFLGSHWSGPPTLTKIDPLDGHIFWSQGYEGYDSHYPFGIEFNGGNVLLFLLGNGYYNDSYIDVYGVRKTDGDTTFTKSIVQTCDRYAARLYGTFQVVQQDNGHYLMSGPTTGSFEFPAFTGTKDLYHAGIIELDEHLNFVKAYGFKNRHEGNSYNTRISLFPDGTGVFTMLHFFSGYNADAYISLFKNDQIYHQRKRIHINEGIPNEPNNLRMPDGGFLNIKTMGDSTKTALDGARIDYYRMHTSDTASLCLGVKDSSTSIWYFNFEPNYNLRVYSIQKNVMSESRPKSFVAHDFTTRIDPACQVISHCDTLSLQASAAVVCPGTGVTLSIHKNKECGSLVPLVYDTTWVRSVTQTSDSSYLFQIDQAGKKWIHASLLGCRLREDSVLIEVLPVRNSLDLGKDTVICPGNSLVLRAGKGFASYQWQDGSTDSSYTVTTPGVYYLTAVNSCGGVYHDTVSIMAHAPIPFSAGPDRSKCNRDTVHLDAPSGFLNYTWTNNYNISSTTAANIVVNPLTDTVYYIKAEKTPGCFAYDTVRVHVNTSPPIDLGADKSFCSGDSAVLNPGGGFSQYSWSNGNNSSTLVVKTTGTYSIIGVTAQGCKSYDTVRVVNVFSNPVVSLNHDQALCAGTSRILDAGMYTSYLWSDGSTGQKITVKDTGSYTVEVTDTHGCKGKDSTKITTVLPVPSDFLPADTLLCSYDKLTVSSLRPFNSYQWNTGGVASAITISQPGLYWLQVTDAKGCVGKDSLLVTPKDCMQGFYIPSAFTPNHDNKNDVFLPLLFGRVVKYRFSIYNRWGRQIFETTELQRGWDGTISGITQDSNVYIWLCSFQLEGGELKTERGTVMLIR